MKVNAVFEGGGVKAIALVGAVKATEECGLRFARLAGTSSGAIIASLLASGYTADEMKELILTTPFTQFLQKGIFHRIYLVGPLIRLFLKKGLYPGDLLERWIATVLAAKGIRTFGDLAPGSLRIIASDISQGKMLVLPDDIIAYGVDPNAFPIARAVRMSTSIPFFFDPVTIRLAGAPQSNAQQILNPPIYVVDGGLLSNFPLWLFDPQEPGASLTPTIGYQLVGKKQGSARPIYGPITMMQALVATMLEAHDERYIENKNRFRTIKVPTLGVATTDFDVPQERSLALFDSGYGSAKAYLEGWSAAKYLYEYEQHITKRK